MAPKVGLTFHSLADAPRRFIKIQDYGHNLELLPWKHGKQWASAGLTVRQT